MGRVGTTSGCVTCLDTQLELIPGPLNLRPPAGLRSSNFVNGPGISIEFKQCNLIFPAVSMLIPGPDGQYFTTANLWTWDQCTLE